MRATIAAAAEAALATARQANGTEDPSAGGASYARPAAAQQPRDWQLGLQDAASPQMERVTDFHNLLLVVITAITLLVMVLLAYVMVRFNEKRNPEPAKTTHNTMVEVLWTVVPVIVLVAIAIPSFKLLYFMDRTTDADMTLKAIGRQWYWSYEYPDDGNFTFDAYMVADEDLQEGQPRLLTTDQAVVLPDGSIEGFVGGACAESTVRAQSLSLLDSGDPLLLRISPSAPAGGATDPASPTDDPPGTLSVVNHCLSGGTLEIFLEPVVPAPVVAVHGESPIAAALAAARAEAREAKGSVEGEHDARPQAQTGS